jgi:hypothetical protein
MTESVLQGYIREIGTWLRRHEPPASLDEDLLGHELRTLMCGLRRDYSKVPRRRVQNLVGAIDLCVKELQKLRMRRGIR